MLARFLLLVSLLGLTIRPARSQKIEGATVAEIEALGASFVHLVNFHEDVDRFNQTFSHELLQAGAVKGLSRALTFMHDEFSPLEFHHAELVQWETPSGPKQTLHAYALDTQDQIWKDFQLGINSGPDYRISKIAFVADVSEPVFLPPSGLEDAFTLNWLDEYMDKLAEAEDLFGSLLVAVGDSVLFEKQMGFEDASRQTPITTDTRFNMASGGKMITGVAIAQLVEAGVLDWQHPVNRWVDGIPDGILLHHLLTHTSGIAEYWTDQNESRMANSADPQHDFLELILEAGTDFPPGSRSSYSNSNYVVAGQVVTAASGREYADYVREEILLPAGMTHTLISNKDDYSFLTAEPLTGGRREWTKIDFTPRPTSAGGAYTTARDMLRFSRALGDGTLLSASMLETITTSKMEGVPDAGNDFGYGFILGTVGQAGFVGHGGQGPGANFGFNMVADGDLTIVLLSNQDNGAFDDLRKNVMKLATGAR